MNPLNRILFERAGRSPELLARLAAQVDREMSPYRVVPASTVLRWVLAAVMRGNLSVVPAFLAAGKRGARAASARRERVALLG